MRVIEASHITEAIKEMCIEANTRIPKDVAACISECISTEDWEPAKEILLEIEENHGIARERNLPICQDTGMVSLFVEVGQDLHIEGNLEEALQEGVRRGYKEGYLRNSVVGDPLARENTGDNTPAVIYYQIVPGDKLVIDFTPKGAGSENMSRIKMLNPAEGIQGVKDFVIETVKMAGPNPCPPIVVGVGIGGTFDKVAVLSKKALLRPLDQRSPEEFYRNLEEELLEEINLLGIGPQGLGGKTTALAVNIEAFPTHIASLPVAVNIGCHVNRHVHRII